MISLPISIQKCDWKMLQSITPRKIRTQCLVEKKTSTKKTPSNLISGLFLPHTAYLYNIHVLWATVDVKWSKISQGRKTRHFLYQQTGEMKECGLRLGTNMKDSHEVERGQCTTSHANVHFTCNTVGDSLKCLAEILFPWLCWLWLRMPSFLITAENRQTLKWGWMQVINIILTNYTMQGESK